MKVAVIGSGGREHALAWKLAQSKTVEKLYAIPGSAAMAEIAECIDIPVSDLEKNRRILLRRRNRHARRRSGSSPDGRLG